MLESQATPPSDTSRGSHTTRTRRPTSWGSFFEWFSIKWKSKKSRVKADVFRFRERVTGWTLKALSYCRAISPRQFFSAVIAKNQAIHKNIEQRFPRVVAMADRCLNSLSNLVNTNVFGTITSQVTSVSVLIGLAFISITAPIYIVCSVFVLLITSSNAIKRLPIQLRVVVIVIAVVLFGMLGKALNKYALSEYQRQQARIVIVPVPSLPIPAPIPAPIPSPSPQPTPLITRQVLRPPKPFVFHPVRRQGNEALTAAEIAERERIERALQQ